MTQREPFYVGYLAIPRRHRRFLQASLPLCILAMLTSAAGLVAAQPPWGDGVWDIAAPKDFSGALLLNPYPALQTADGLLLVVGSLKTAPRAADLAAAGFADGDHVTVRGHELRRDGRRIVSLESDRPLSITAASSNAAAPTPRFSSPAVRLEGEILDAKCYLGAMKPGYGRGHKACATTCIQGGIPPMLVTPGPTYHLLTRADGSALTDEDLAAIAPHIAEPVTVEGSLGSLGAWSLLAIDPRTAITPR